jgi:hypothetical protein
MAEKKTNPWGHELDEGPSKTEMAPKKELSNKNEWGHERDEPTVTPKYKERKREYSIFEHAPIIGGTVKKAKEDQHAKLLELEKKYPGFLERYDRNQSLMGGAKDFTASMLLSLLSRGNIPANMVLQGGYSGVSDILERAAEKGPRNLSGEDYMSAIKEGSKGAAFAYAPKFLSPLTPDKSMQSVFKGIKDRLSVPPGARGMGDAARVAGEKQAHRGVTEQLAGRMENRVRNIVGAPATRLATTIIGGLSGGYFGGGLGTALGGALTGYISPSAARGAAKLIGNKIFAHPMIRALATAGGTTAAKQYKDPNDITPYDINMGNPINAP